MLSFIGVSTFQIIAIVKYIYSLEQPRGSLSAQVIFCQINSVLLLLLPHVTDVLTAPHPLDNLQGVYVCVIHIF